MRHFPIRLIALFLSFVPLATSDIEATQRYLIVDSTTGLYESPGEGSIGLVIEGQFLLMVEQIGDWYQVVTPEGNEEGFIFTAFVREIGLDEVKEIRIREKAIYVKVAKANIREQPSIDSKIVEKFQTGQLLFQQEKQADWIRVMWEEGDSYGEGWIHARLIASDHPLASTVRRRKFVDSYKLNARNRQDILAGKIRLGMTREEVRASWGDPGDINRAAGVGYVHEQWVYSDSTYLYFDDGILTSWQD